MYKKLTFNDHLKKRLNYYFVYTRIIFKLSIYSKLYFIQISDEFHVNLRKFFSKLLYAVKFIFFFFC